MRRLSAPAREDRRRRDQDRDTRNEAAAYGGSCPVKALTR
jgi:hypothetical protein